MAMTKWDIPFITRLIPLKVNFIIKFTLKVNFINKVHFGKSTEFQYELIRDYNSKKKRMSKSKNISENNEQKV